MKEVFSQWIRESKRIVFFGGAGVSVESGIPDFRSVDGLYSQKFEYPPETMLSHDFFMRRPEAFYRFYRDKMIIKGAKPNPLHMKLAQWEAEGKLSAIVTQNIDGLHRAAGSKNVYELHGSTLRNYCMKCGRKYGVEAVCGREPVPKCECGGIIRPDVVLYGENLPSGVLSRAVQAIEKADMLIVGGTSLVVYPAAGLIDYYSGDRLVLVNRDPTPRDGRANLIFRDPIGQLFSTLP